MVKTRILLFLLTLIIVPTLTYLVVLFARGYRISPTQGGQISPTGLLVATSDPNGAQLFVNGELKSATNTTLNLPPGDYTVEIKKEGFSPWKKVLHLEAEIVTRADATLFPSVPSLRAVTSSGGSTPYLSPDGGKLAFILFSDRQSKVYTTDLSESPLGQISRESRLLTTLPGQPLLTWDPDSRQLLATSTDSATLIDIANSQKTTPIASPSGLLTTWLNTQKLRDAQKLTVLPVPLQALLASSAANLVWSPNDKKLMYIATDSATLAQNYKRPLPGSNTQPQSRTLEAGKIYIYDLEEDRNYFIGQAVLPSPTPTNNPKAKTAITPSPTIPFALPLSNLSWFPSSNHVVRVESDQITIMEYDGQNPTVVYAGPMSQALAIPYPSGKNMLLLTNLNPTTSTLPNFYALSLK